MPLIFLLILVFIPWLEFSLAAWIHQELRLHMSSGQATLSILLWFFLMFSLGINLVKTLGLKLFVATQTRLRQGLSPESHVIEALILLLAGIALVIPGFGSDFIGAFLFIPGMRPLLAKLIKTHLEKRIKVVNFTSSAHPHQSKASVNSMSHDLVIDVESKEVNPPSLDKPN